MEFKPFYDVVIVGAGPVGTALANLTGKYGCSTLIIDCAEDVLEIPRAIGLCEEGSRVLEACGVMQGFNEHTLAIKEIRFDKPLGTTLFTLNTDREKNGYPEMRTFYQPKLERCLRDVLSQRENVHLRSSTEYLKHTDKESHVELSLKQDDKVHEIQCRFLIGCDGSSSSVRKELNMGYKGRTYGQEWLIFDAENDLAPDQNVVLLGNKERPGITLPAPAGKRRWEFVVKQGDSVEQLFSDGSIAELLSPWGNIEDLAIERKTTYTFHARSANQFRRGNVFLAGDAAHVTPPFAGQGLMAGFRDCYNLAWKLSAVLQGRVHERVLDSYQSERKPQVKQITFFAEFIGSMLLPQSNLSVSIRDMAIKVMSFFGFFSMNGGGGFRKLENHINGSLLRHLWTRKFKKTGVELPQFEVVSEAGQLSLSDTVLGDHFYIIGLNSNPAEGIDESTLERWKAIGGRFAAFNMLSDSGTVESAKDECLNLRCDDVPDPFEHPDSVLVIRPDKMVVINARSNELTKRVSAYTESLLS